MTDKHRPHIGARFHPAPDHGDPFAGCLYSGGMLDDRSRIISTYDAPATMLPCGGHLLRLGEP